MATPNQQISGWLIYQNTYALVSTTVTVVVGWGLAGLIWILSKKSGNVVFYTMFRANLTKFCLNFGSEARSKMTKQQYALLFLFVSSLFMSQLGTLLNLIVAQYIGLGVATDIQSTIVAGLGPLSYLSSQVLANVGNATNTINYGLLAYLFQNSPYLNSGSSCNSNKSTSCFVDIPIDTSCNPTINALMNAQNSIANKGTGFDFKNTIYPAVVYDDLDEITSAHAYMGTYTVNAILGSTANNNINFILQTLSTATDASYYFQPLFSTASFEASYLITWGLKGQKDITGSIQSLNDTLTTSLIDVVNIQFGSDSPGYTELLTLDGTAFCYEALELAGATFFCNPTKLTDDGLNSSNGTETFEFIVFGTDQADLNSKTTTLLAFTEAVYLTNSFSTNLHLKSDGSVISQPFDSSSTQYYWKNFRVTTKTQTVVTYNQPSVSSKTPTAILTSLGSFASSCQRGNGRGVFNPDSSFNPGQVVVIISYAFVSSFMIFGTICLVFFWFNDSEAILTDTLKEVYIHDSDPKNTFVKEVFFNDGKVKDAELAMPVPVLANVRVEIKE